MGKKRKETEDTTSDKTEVEVSQEKQPVYEASKGTGREHWGLGGKFRILPNGRRVRVIEKE